MGVTPTTVWEKFLLLKRGHRLSRKYHERKNHTIRILDGHLNLEVGPHREGGEIEVVPTVGPWHGVLPFPANTIHRFCAGEADVRLHHRSELPCRVLTTSVRLEDDYRRVTDIPEDPRASSVTNNLLF